MKCPKCDTTIEIDVERLSDIVWNYTPYQLDLNTACKLAQAIAKACPIKVKE